MDDKRLHDLDARLADLVQREKEELRIVKQNFSLERSHIQNERRSLIQKKRKENYAVFLKHSLANIISQLETAAEVQDYDYLHSLILYSPRQKADLPSHGERIYQLSFDMCNELKSSLYLTYYASTKRVTKKDTLLAEFMRMPSFGYNPGTDEICTWLKRLVVELKLFYKEVEKGKLPSLSA